MASLLSGAVFGAATVAAGVYSPSVIINQFKFDDWHMLQTFLGATASSAVIYKIAERLGYVNVKPRSSSPVGLFGQYDGNVIGGFLLGTDRALCPWRSASWWHRMDGIPRKSSQGTKGEGRSQA
ncbi:hypothetical protein NM208_g16103 [Fusarium decemcellulare]|uniref:Uncharacterized protein n=1 Tax=Fusarium decemcellulare TaxID=57161 RepID=A0ACC1RB47_9HYPO|nr:hypothetical protein NM208_g16103 [Fusarium decemcellulare]